MGARVSCGREEEMKRLAMLVCMVLACSRTPMGLHAPDGGSSRFGGAGGGEAGARASGGSPGNGGAIGVATPTGSGGSLPHSSSSGVGGVRSTGGMAGTGGSTLASGGSTATTDLDACSTDADCLSSCIWVTAPTNSSQCTAFYCCGMTQISKRRCDHNQTAWASYCPNQAPENQPCPCVALCQDPVFGCFGGQCAVACPTRADAAPDAVSVTNNDAGHLCGDGVVNGPEECDLGQQNNTAVYGDRVGCTRDCTSPHYCGDGILDPGLWRDVRLWHQQRPSTLHEQLHLLDHVARAGGRLWLGEQRSSQSTIAWPWHGSPSRSRG
jgi:hypothetical protein